MRIDEQITPAGVPVLLRMEKYVVEDNDGGWFEMVAGVDDNAALTTEERLS